MIITAKKMHELASEVNKKASENVLKKIPEIINIINKNILVSASNGGFSLTVTLREYMPDLYLDFTAQENLIRKQSLNKIIKWFQAAKFTVRDITGQLGNNNETIVIDWKTGR